MREITELKRKEQKSIQIKSTKNINLVLNILDHMIAGKRFGELDSAKQMYLLDCQARIDEMQEGYFKEQDIVFLNECIDSLIKTLMVAKGDLYLLEKGKEE